MKIITILGARPQFIKAAPMSKAFLDSAIHEEIIHTGQHYDKNLGDTFELLAKKLGLNTPILHLNHGAKSQGVMLGDMISDIAKILEDKKPDFTLVYGDTTSTLAGGLASAKAQIPIIHIESGLRSFDPLMPEEQNRVLTDHLSSYLFCPSNTAISNLENENIHHKNVVIKNIGDIMLDSKLLFEPFATKIELKNFDLKEPFFIASIHRAENITPTNQDHKIFFTILNALDKIAKNTPLLFIMHPRNKNAIHLALESKNPPKHIYFIPPQDYLSMLFLLQHTQGVITDSGGLQKEAYYFKKRALIIRNTTEWSELISCGAHQLTTAEQIPNTFDTILKQGWLNFDMPTSLYGDGNSAQKVIATLKGEV